jgi:hypothetical protein
MSSIILRHEKPSAKQHTHARSLTPDLPLLETPARLFFKCSAASSCTMTSIALWYVPTTHGDENTLET